MIYSKDFIAANTPAVNPLGTIYDPAAGNLGRSGALELLPPQQFVQIQGRPVDEANALYVDYEAARQSGIAVPQGHALTPEFEKDLTRNYAIRLDSASSEEPVTMHASRYAQSEGNHGDGRGAFFENGNLFAKGIGATPLVGKKANVNHSNGWYLIHGALVETLWAIVYDHLLSLGAPRTVAILGLNTLVKADSRIPFPEPAVVLLRSGLQIRPAHFVEQSVYSWHMQQLVKSTGIDQKPDLMKAGNHLVTVDDSLKDGPTGGTVDVLSFFKSAQACELLRFRRDPVTGRDVPDIAETMKAMLDNFALTAAQQFRWRIIHGGPSAGNIEIDGGSLDLETSSSNPRTGRFYSLAYTTPFGEEEFRLRANNVRMVYESLGLNLSPEEMAAYHYVPVDFDAEFRASYLEHVTVEFLKATGLKEKVAERIAQEHPEIAARFRNNLLSLALLANPGEPPMAIDQNGIILEDAERVVSERAVVDVFNLLRRYPTSYFTDAGDKNSAILEFLDPIYLGDDALRAQNAAEVTRLADDFAGLYETVMTLAESAVGSEYTDQAGLQLSVTSRAAFENKPLDKLYLWDLRKIVAETLADENRVRQDFMDPERFSSFINQRATQSLRVVDKLLRQGDVTEQPDGTLEIETKTLNYRSLGLRVDKTTGQTRLFVRIPLSESAGGSFASPAIVGATLKRSQLENATLSFTISQGEPRTAKAHIEDGALVFETPLSAYEIGLFEARIDIAGQNPVSVPEYAFAVPDAQELRNLEYR